MTVYAIKNADGELVAEFEVKEAAEAYAETASNGPFTVTKAKEARIPGATEDES